MTSQSRRGSTSEATRSRVRVGVGKGPVPSEPGAERGRVDGAAGWVLGDFPSAQAALIDAIVARSADAAETVVGLGIRPAMNDFNGKPTLT
jgi:peptidyl-tRNA hydrolase